MRTNMQEVEALCDLLSLRLPELSQSVFAKELSAGRLADEKYAAFLRSLDHVWETLESLSSASLKSEIQRLRGALDQDLRQLAVAEDAKSLAALYGVLWAQEARFRFSQHPDLLWVDILTLGDAIARGLALPVAWRHSLADHYLRSVANETSWLRSCSLTVDVARSGLDAAMARAIGLFQALSVESTVGMEDAVTLLNPEAGRHAIPEDVREVAVALRAGELSYENFPYMECRYGARGRRFARSDSAWLVTLSGSEPYAVHKHVGWLSRVLANRGMPRLLLERHLLVLHRELVQAFADRVERYAHLAAASEQLAEARRAYLSDANVEHLERLFCEHAGAAHPALQVGMGSLIASACADEADGLLGTVKGLLSFLEDPSRFEPRWLEAVHATHRAARAMCR